MSKHLEYVRSQLPINCTTIVKEIPASIVDEFYNRVTESIIDYDWNNETIDRELKMPNYLIGGFIDYYLRHEIAKTHNLELRDFRTEQFNSDCPCYKKFKNKQANIKEIYVTSLSLQKAFGHSIRKCPRAYKAIPKGFHFNGLDEWAASMTGNDILLNPAVGSDILQIGADTSLIVDDEIIHFKFVKKRTKRNFMQVLIYAACCKACFNEYINKVSLLYVRCGQKYTYTLNHQIIDDIYELLLKSIPPQPSEDDEPTEQ